MPPLLFVPIFAAILFSVAAATSSRHFTRAVNLTSEFSTPYYFDQLIDHNNPSLGTFKQRYFFSDEFWGGFGSPILFVNLGEISADGLNIYLTGPILPRGLLQVYGAAGIALEHRYYGQSSPFQVLSAENLQYLTVEQAIADNVYFAQNVQLPFSNPNAPIGNTSPDHVPWINFGGSYSGVLVAFAQEAYPGVFAAAWASSAGVEANGDFWEYWAPVEEGLPKNCSSDLAASISFIDSVLLSGDAQAATDLKARFSLQNLENDDFGYQLMMPWITWQDLHAAQYKEEGEDAIHLVCDIIEIKADGTINRNKEGVGLEQALANLAAAWTDPDIGLNSCPELGGDCVGQRSHTYTDPMFTDTSLGNDVQRQWTWLLCNELGVFTPGDPGNTSTIVSSVVDEAHFLRICDHTFLNPDGSPGSYSTDAAAQKLNSKYRGWNIVADNLFVVNGQYDPWRSASLSSSWAPPDLDIPSQNIHIIRGAHHCWDFNLDDSVVNKDVLRVQNTGIEVIHGWLEEWYAAHPDVPNLLLPLPDPKAKYGYLTDTINALAAVLGASPSSSSLPSPATSTMSLPTKLAKPEADLLAASASVSSPDIIAETSSSWWTNKTFSMTSFILNIVLLAVITVAVVAYLRAARPWGKRVAGPKWLVDNATAIAHGDALEEYGTGQRGGGRGVYKVLEDEKGAA